TEAIPKAYSCRPPWSFQGHAGTADSPQRCDLINGLACRTPVFPASVSDVVQDESERVRLSVVVATVHPWPELAVCLDALVAQVRETQSELIVADGDG